MYYVYMLRCEDNSIYTGITTNINRRMEEHFSKGPKCAKYTLKRTAKKLESVWQTENRVLASKLEYHIKKLSKLYKEELILNNNLEKFLADKIDVSKFNTSKVTDMNNMFESSPNLTTIYVSNKFLTDKVTSSSNMFSGDTKLVGGAGTVYDSSNIDKTYARIDGGTSSPGYFTAKQ